MCEIGTYQWNQKSRGFLSRKKKFRIVGMLVKAQIVNTTEHGPEAKLLGNGAYLDIVGLRHYCLTTDAIQRVHKLYPREQFVPEILRIMSEIQHPPDTRSGFMSNIGIDFLAKRNPLDKGNR